jgi:hypothetical protein
MLPGRYDVLLRAHDEGAAAGVKVYAGGSHSCGGAGRENDGVWRMWELDGTQRVSFRVGHMGAEPVTVRVRDIIDWALPRIPAEAWVTLERLRDARSKALHEEYGDTDLWRRSTYQPDRITPVERARLAEASTRRYAAERALDRLITEHLAVDEVEPAAGEQLELFA